MYESSEEDVQKKVTYARKMPTKKKKFTPQLSRNGGRKWVLNADVTTFLEAVVEENSNATTTQHINDATTNPYKKM